MCYVLRTLTVGRLHGLTNKFLLIWNCNNLHQVPVPPEDKTVFLSIHSKNDNKYKTVLSCIFVLHRLGKWRQNKFWQYVYLLKFDLLLHYTTSFIFKSQFLLVILLERIEWFRTIFNRQHLSSGKPMCQVTLFFFSVQK